MGNPYYTPQFNVKYAHLAAGVAASAVGVRFPLLLLRAVVVRLGSRVAPSGPPRDPPSGPPGELQQSKIWSLKSQIIGPFP